MQYEVILPAAERLAGLSLRRLPYAVHTLFCSFHAERSFDGERRRLDKLQFIFHSLCCFEQRFHIFIITIKPILWVQLFFTDCIFRIKLYVM